MGCENTVNAGNVGLKRVNRVKRKFRRCKIPKFLRMSRKVKNLYFS